MGMPAYGDDIGGGAGDHDDGNVFGAEADDKEAADRATVGLSCSGRRRYQYIRGPTDALRRPAVAGAARARQSMLMQGLMGSRTFLVRDKSYPVGVFSVIPYSIDVEERRAKTRLSSGLAELVVNDNTPEWLRWKGKSYKSLLRSTWRNRRHRMHGPASIASSHGRMSRGSDDSDRERDHEGTPGGRYNPYYLDDPRIRRNTITKQHKLPGYIMSIVVFATAADLKADLNKRFRTDHPTLNPDLTLTQIRNLKQRVLDMCVKLKLEVGTVALAHVSFEKLVLKRLVNKSNRKLVMAVCVVLAYKFNEPATDKVKKLLSEIELVLHVGAKQVLKAEFVVFTHLEFELHVPPVDVDPHFQRLLESRELKSAGYLDEAMHNIYYPRGVMMIADDESDNDGHSALWSMGTAAGSDGGVDDDDDGDGDGDGDAVDILSDDIDLGAADVELDLEVDLEVAEGHGGAVGGRVGIAGDDVAMFGSGIVAVDEDGPVGSA